jgi:hypothetical protein
MRRAAIRQTRKRCLSGLIARRVFDGLKVRGKGGAKVSTCRVFLDISLVRDDD